MRSRCCPVPLGGFFGYKILFANSDEGAHSAKSDEDQINALVQTWTADLNNRDLEGLKSLMCSGSASQLPQDLFSTRNKIGPLSSSVSNIKVTGDQATASITSTRSNGSHNGETDTYGRENSWKICHIVNF